MPPGVDPGTGAFGQPKAPGEVEDDKEKPEGERYAQVP